MSFFLLGANERIGKTDKLMKLFKLVNWDRVDKCLSNLRKNALYSLGGPKGYNGPVEKWEDNDKNLRNWPKIKWPIYIINH